MEIGRCSKMVSSVAAPAMLPLNHGCPSPASSICYGLYCAPTHSSGRIDLATRIDTGRSFPCSKGTFQPRASVTSDSYMPSTSVLVAQEVDFVWKGEGSEVLLTGDFLNWEAKVPLVKDATGIFHVKQKLSPGKYRYKFIVDGKWMHSADAPAIPDGAGGLNNEIFIEEQEEDIKILEKDAAKTDTSVASKPKQEQEEDIKILEKDAAKTDTSVASKPKAKPALQEAEKAPKATPAAAKAPKKIVISKPFAETISEDVMPLLKASLEKEDDVANVDLLFDDNQLQGAFTKQGVPYSFWAYFPDGKLEGSKGFSVSSYGSPPSTIEPFLIDEKKITAELLVFWVTKRLNAQRTLSEL